VFGCISKTVSDSEVKQLLRILVKALESYTDLTLIEAIIMCLTRLQPLLRQVGSCICNTACMVVLFYLNRSGGSVV